MPDSLNHTPLRIVVTGASSGIGKAIADRLVSQGHQVIGLARRFPASTHRNDTQVSDQSLHLACDVSEWNSVAAIAQNLESRFKSLDALICCAAVQGEIRPLLESDPVQWEATVQTNLNGTYFAIRAFASLLKKAERRAKILCFSGGGASRARPGFSSYAAAKTGVVRLVETLAAELENLPFDVNAIAPGAIPTFMIESIIAAGPELAGSQEYQAALSLNQTDPAPMKRALDLVQWLLSPQSDGISGRFLSATWDPWKTMTAQSFKGSEAYMLRRTLP